MAKVARREPQQMETYLVELFLVLSNRKPKETEALLNDLLTPMERKMLAKRIQVAKMLLTGKKYHEIEKELNVQRATIARVRHALNLSPSRALEEAATRLPNLKPSSIV